MLAEQGDVQQFLACARLFCPNRRFVVTQKGYCGLAPAAVREDDVLVVLFGGNTPYFLRPHEGDYLFLGEGYTHGLMQGEAIDMLEEGELESQVFRLR